MSPQRVKHLRCIPGPGLREANQKNSSRITWGSHEQQIEDYNSMHTHGYKCMFVNAPIAFTEESILLPVVAFNTIFDIIRKKLKM